MKIFLKGIPMSKYYKYVIYDHTKLVSPSIVQNRHRKIWILHNFHNYAPKQVSPLPYANWFSTS